MTKLRVTGCHFIVSLDIYYKDILFTFGYGPDKIDLILSRLEGNDVETIRGMIKAHDLNLDRGTSFVGDNATVLIQMPHLPETPEQYGTLTHEIFHAVEAIMVNVGNPLVADGSNCEPWAHMLGYIVAQVYERLNQYPL